MTRRIDLRLILKDGVDDRDVLEAIADLCAHDDIVAVTVDRHELDRLTATAEP